MINLIKNEIYKIFHKLSTYIVLIIALLFVILTNVIYREFDDFETVETLSEIDINEVNNYINNYNPETDSIEDYAYNLALLDSYNLSKNYSSDSWEYNVFMTKYLDLNTEYYILMHSDNPDEEKIANLNKSMLAILQAVYQSDWRYFVSLEQSELEMLIASYDEALEIANLSNDDKLNYNKQKYIAEEELELLNYRLEENVPYGNDYLNTAINNIENNLYTMADYMYDLDSPRETYAAALKTYHENKYILEEKIDTNDSSTLRSVIMNFYNEYAFLIIVFIIMIAGSIVSDEFSRGTIKSLLTIPHSRSKILLAKYLTVILLIPFIILFLLVCELLIGGLLLGFDSLSIPAVVYNIAHNGVDILNVFSYFGLYTLANLPELLLLTTLAFTCSIILNNTAFAVAITFCGMIASQIINGLAISYDIKVLDYFVTTNWDFTVFLFGGSSPFGLTIAHGVMVCLTYLILMLLIGFAIFTNKDIKNV